MGKQTPGRKAFEFQIKELYFSFERKGNQNRQFGYIKLEPKNDAVIELEEDIVSRFIPQEEGFEISVDEEEYFREDLPTEEAIEYLPELKAASVKDIQRFTEEIIVKAAKLKAPSEKGEEFWDFEEETNGGN